MLKELAQNMSPTTTTTGTITQKPYEILTTTNYVQYGVVIVPLAAFVVFFIWKTEPGRRLFLWARYSARRILHFTFGRLIKKTVDVLWQSPYGSSDGYGKLLIREIELAGGLELRLIDLSSDGQEQKRHYNRPVLVLANSVTRLAIDVDHALRNIEPTNMVAVMIVHNMAPHVENQVLDSRMMLCSVDPKYNKLGLIVDLIVYDGRLSQYIKNKRSIGEVVNFLRSRS